MDAGYKQTRYWNRDVDPWKNKLSGERLFFFSAECEDDHGRFVIRLPMLTWDEVVDEVLCRQTSTEIVRLDVYTEDSLDEVVDETGQTLRERMFGGLYEVFYRYVDRTLDDYHKEQQEIENA